MLLLLIGILAVGASPEPTASPSIPSVDIDALASTITSTQLYALVRGVFSFGENRSTGKAAPLRVIVKLPSEMPPDDPYMHYAGLDQNGQALVWRVAVDTAASKAFIEKFMKTYEGVSAAAAADSGAAGADWKTLYDRLGAVRFELLATRVFVLRSDAEKKKSAEDLTWIEKNIRLRTARQDVYAMLKKRGLIAYNAAYNPGRPAQGSPPTSGHPAFTGCDYSQTMAQSYWPYFNEPIPKGDGVCGSFQRTGFVPNPTAYVDFSMGFDMMCGMHKILTLRFDLHDRLSRMQQSRAGKTCV